MNGELRWQYLDRLANVYGAIRTHADRAPSVASELVQVLSGLQHRTFSMGDLSAFLSPRQDPALDAQKKIAWISQHVFSARAWCVGQFITEGSGGAIRCSFLQQARKLGIRTQHVDLQRIRNAWQSQVVDEKIDTVLFDVEKSRIYIVAAQSYTKTKKLSPSLRLARGTEGDTLWGASNAFVLGACVPASTIAALEVTRQILATAMPNFQVRAFLAIVDDAEGSAKFQLHETTSCGGAIAGAGQKCSLDDIPVYRTHVDFAVGEDASVDHLLGLPSWQDLDPLRKAPFDVQTRALLILSVLAELQQASNSRLVLRSITEIAKLVSERSSLHYPKNMARHDIERLQRIGLLAYGPDGSARLGLTGAGVARIAVVEHRFNPMVPSSTEIVLDRIGCQENLWLEAASV